MRRRWIILGIFAALSCALGILSATMWIRSHYNSDRVSVVSAELEGNIRINQRWLLVSAGGGLNLHLTEFHRPSQGYLGPMFWQIPAVGERSWAIDNSGGPPVRYPMLGHRAGKPWAAIGFEFLTQELHYGTLTLPDDSWLWSLTVPYWFIQLIMTAPSVLLIRQWCRLNRRLCQVASDICSNCSYDLRASKDRCPECGRPILPTLCSGDRKDDIQAL